MWGERSGDKWEEENTQGDLSGVKGRRKGKEPAYEEGEERVAKVSPAVKKLRGDSEEWYAWEKEWLDWTGKWPPNQDSDSPSEGGEIVMGPIGEDLDPQLHEEEEGEQRRPKAYGRKLACGEPPFPEIVEENTSTSTVNWSKEAHECHSDGSGVLGNPTAGEGQQGEQPLKTPDAEQDGRWANPPTCADPTQLKEGPGEEVEGD